jgi:hypothetical protein
MSDEYVIRVDAEAGQPGGAFPSGHGQIVDGTSSGSANKTRSRSAVSWDGSGALAPGQAV